MSRNKRLVRRYARPRSHYLVLTLNIVVVFSLLIAGVGMLWANNRLNTRQVVSLNRDPIAKPSTDAEITPSDSWNLTEGDLAGAAATVPNREPAGDTVATLLPLRGFDASAGENLMLQGDRRSGQP